MGKRNMNEYYTTRSLATAAAAIEQGFEGCETKDVFDNWRPWFANNPTSKYRFPKTQHNVALMDGKEGDFVLVDGGIYSGYGQYKADYSGSLYIIRDELLRDIGSPPFNYTIIHRNNKPFPVWEKEGK